MAVAFDAQSSTSDNGAPTSLTFSHTVGGSDRLLVVGYTYRSGSGRTVTATYNGVSMTRIGSEILQGGIRVGVFRLLAPATGANNVVVSWNTAPGGNGMTAVSASYTGADQTTPLGTHQVGQGNSNDPTVAITGAAGQLLVDMVGVELVTTLQIGPGAGQTQRVEVASAFTFNGISDAPSTTDPMHWPFTGGVGADDWVIFALPVNPSATLISPSAIASAEAFGVAKVNQTISPSGIASGEAMGTPAMGGNIRPTGIVSGEAVGTPRLLRGAATLSPSGIASAMVFGTTALRFVLNVYPIPISSAQAFGTAVLTLIPEKLIRPTGILTATAFGTAVLTNPQRVTPADAAMSPTGISSGETFGQSSTSFGTTTGLGFPTLRIDIAFASNPLDTPVWTDVTEYVQEFDITRGRQHPVDRFEAGQASLTLDNRDRRFDPTYTGSPYYPNVIPRRRIRIRATRGTTRYLFSGFVESWPQDTRDVGDATVQVSCTDGFLFLTKVALTYDGFPYSDRSLRSDQAIAWILDHSGWPTLDRDLNTGVFTVLLEADTTSVPLTLLQDIAVAEGGSIYLTVDGRVRFVGYNTLFAAPYSTSRGTFGDDPAEMPYKEAIPIYDEQHLWNQVVVTATGLQLPANTGGDTVPEEETKAQVDDATSQSKYFLSQLALTLPLISLQDAQSLAQAYLEQYKEPRLYVGTLEHEWSGLDDVMDQMLDRELLDRITVTRRPMGGGSPMTGDYHIERIRHHFRADAIWQTTWDLAPVPSGSPLTPGVLGAVAATFSLRETLYFGEQIDRPAVS